MKRLDCELLIIGSGPAGLAAAIEAHESGLRRILLLERDKELGGILLQCIHNGFGLHEFQEELSGPEYAQRFINQLEELEEVEWQCETTVLELEQLENGHKLARALNEIEGYFVVEAQTVILAMGCRERTRGAISIPGNRPAGVFTAGAAQQYINMEGYMVGRRAVILGSGDIGLIMARRMTLEGAKVEAVLELQSFSGGLRRNIVQCLDDYDIPLLLSHTVVEILGKERVEAVRIAKVDATKKPIPATERLIECDTLLLSVGLIPENEIPRKAGIAIDPASSGAVVQQDMETSMPGVYACGNVLHVHDLVDFVSAEARKAARAAAHRVLQGNKSKAAAPPIDSAMLTIAPGLNVLYTVPQRVQAEELEQDLEVFFRVCDVFSGAEIQLRSGAEVLTSHKRPHLAPGEMEKLKIPKKILSQCQQSAQRLEICVQIAEARASEG